MKWSITTSKDRIKPWNIAVLFYVWKILLVIIAVLSPGPGYDTSTTLLFESDSRAQHAAFTLSALVSRLVQRLVRWDAIYFVKVADRGRIFEQEWAFGYGHTIALSLISSVLPIDFLPSSFERQALAGILLSQICHALSTMLIYALALRCLPITTPKRQQIAGVAACLYIISPAGIFLLAPYTEAPFASFNLAGLYLLTFVRNDRTSMLASINHAILSILAGVMFGLASTFRGNGIFSLLAFVPYGLTIAHRWLTLDIRFTDFIRLFGLANGVLATVVGFIYPQAIAYQIYCPGVQSRPWCKNMPPSIFTFVQKQYWNNGFLQYWTLSNLPLFVIATPMLILLFFSAVMPFVSVTKRTRKESRKAAVKLDRSDHDHEEWLSVVSAALPQLCLAVFTFTSFHVQIINRISSGYPLWYVTLATLVVKTTNHKRSESRLVEYIVRGMIMYAIIQGVLYASFLPPA